MMRSERDPAIVGIVLDGVPGDEVVVVGTRIVADEDASRIVIHQIIGHGGVDDAAQMNALTAVKTFAANEGRPDAGTYRTSGGERLKIAIISGHMIVGNRDVRRVDHDNTLK